MGFSEKCFSFFGFGFIYWIAFDICDYFDFVDSFAPGISLFFLPAGVKLVAALTAVFWGVAGTVVVLAFTAVGFWSDQPPWFYVVYASLSGFISLISLRLMMQVLSIQTDLSNLKILHLPIIDFVAASLHGIVVNAFYILLGMTTLQDLGLRAAAMAFGDFLGGLVLLLSYALIAKTQLLHYLSTALFKKPT